MDFFHSAAQRRPGGLRWPGPESDLSSLTIRVDLGPRISMMKLADSVSDLASVVELGTKWGESLAQSAAAWDVAYVLRRGDRHGLERLLERELGGGPESEELLHFVRGHEKVPTGGQVVVSVGGQLEVPTVRVVS